MRSKAKKILNTVSIVSVIISITLILSFISNRINDYNEKTSVVSQSITYKEPEKITENIKYEQATEKTQKIISEKKEETDKEEISYKPATGDIILPYSPDEIIYLEETGDYRTHNGIDIKTENNGAFAIEDGIINDVYCDINNNYVIRLKHKEFISVYRNMNIGPDIIQGKQVKKGDIIGHGIIGDNGEEYIHFEIEKDGVYCNPEEFF